MNQQLARFAVLAVLLLAAGCGGGDKPSERALSDAVYEGDSFSSTINDFGESAAREMATCAAKTWRDSDISGEYLKAIASNTADFVPSDDDVAAMESANKRVQAGCF